MLILVDMDGTIADWGYGYGATLDLYGEDAANIPRHKDQRTFDLRNGLTRLEQAIVAESMDMMRYIDLPVIPGAVGALRGLANLGHDVLICTSPWLSNKFCAQDKLDWVEKKLGKAWAERVIITKDKTLVRGNILIDDKPDIKGRVTPTWEHVLFDQPYNQDRTQRRIKSWKEWRNLV